MGDATDLEELLGNLIDNAAKWAASAVEIRCWPEEDDFHLIVKDDGPGIPEHNRLEILEPGIRLDSVAPGTGFGLAIVSELVDAYHGTLKLSDAEPSGLYVAVRIPSSPSTQTVGVGEEVELGGSGVHGVAPVSTLCVWVCVDTHSVRIPPIHRYSVLTRKTFTIDQSAMNHCEFIDARERV